MSSALPLVSAVITTWNGERYLREAIDSALAQDYPALEVIVVDDGSTDATEEICRSYRDRIRYFRQPKDDKHGATAYVLGMREARGKYIAPLDHDDRWLRGKTTRQVGVLEAQPDAGVAFTRFRIIDEHGQDKGVSPLVGASGDVFHLLLESNRFCHASSMFRADVLRSVGGVNTEIGCGDWDLWLRISREYPVIALDDVLTEYRVHPGGYSQNPARMVSILKNVVRAQRERWHAPDCAECRRASARGIAKTNELYLAHFHSMARNGEHDGLFRMFLVALRSAPSAMFRPRNMAAVAHSLWRNASRRIRTP